MPTVALNNGVAMPMLGFGVFQITDLEACERSVRDALQTGYRLIDTAALYLNEAAVGNAIRKSGVPRNEIFVTSKVWIQAAGYEGTRQAFAGSLAKLRLEYLDLYLIHQPYGDVYGCWRALEELYREGRVRAIGVSNFQPDRVLDLIMHNTMVPAVNQIETHPFCQQIEAQQFLQAHSVQIQSWAPLAEGRNNLFANDVLCAVGQKHGKTVAQVVLRWLTQRGVAVIPKSVHKARIVENFTIFDFELSPEDMAAISKLDRKVSSFFDHRDPATVQRLGSRKIGS